MKFADGSNLTNHNIDTTQLCQQRPAAAPPTAKPTLGKQVELELDQGRHRAKLRVPSDWVLAGEHSCSETFWPNTWLPRSQVHDYECTAITAYGSLSTLDEFISSRGDDLEMDLALNVASGPNRVLVFRGKLRGQTPYFSSYCFAAGDADAVYLNLRGPPAAEEFVLDDFKRVCATLQAL